MIIIGYETVGSLTIDNLCIKIKKMKGAAMNDEEIRYAIMDPCFSDQDVWEILQQYEQPPLSTPFTAEEIEHYCKENEETILLMEERRPQLIERIRQEAIEAHQNCCSPQPEK